MSLEVLEEGGVEEFSVQPSIYDEIRGVNQRMKNRKDS